MSEHVINNVPNICRTCGKTVWLWFLATGLKCPECTDFHGHYRKKQFDEIDELFKEEL